MEFELKQLTQEALPKALERAQRYRLLNEPEQAESICRDVLRTDPENEDATVLLILSLTDQLSSRPTQRTNRSRELVAGLPNEYQRSYYSGLICERRARATMKRGVAGGVAYGWFRDAMKHYEKAETLRPAGNDDAILRWNSCARSIQENRLEPMAEEGQPIMLE